MTTFATYGRLTGRTGKEHTVAGTKTEPIHAQLETPGAALRVTLRPNGQVELEVSPKDHSKARANGWSTMQTFDLDHEAGL